MFKIFVSTLMCGLLLTSVDVKASGTCIKCDTQYSTDDGGRYHVRVTCQEIPNDGTLGLACADSQGKDKSSNQSVSSGGSRGFDDDDFYYDEFEDVY